MHVITDKCLCYQAIKEYRSGHTKKCERQNEFIEHLPYIAKSKASARTLPLRRKEVVDPKMEGTEWDDAVSWS